MLSHVTEWSETRKVTGVEERVKILIKVIPVEDMLRAIAETVEPCVWLGLDFIIIGVNFSTPKSVGHGFGKAILRVPSLG